MKATVMAPEWAQELDLVWDFVLALLLVQQMDQVWVLVLGQVWDQVWDQV